MPVRKALENKRRNTYSRESRQRRGYDSNWERLRAAYLRANPLCETCLVLDEETVRPATIVHHLQSIEERPDLRFVWSNLRALCRDCHERTHGRAR